MFFKKQITALKYANRWRERKVWEDNLLDFASNDYLGLSHFKKSAKRAFRDLQKHQIYAPRASMLVNGYTQVHRDFEELLAKSCGFESAMLLGSGFLANIALIDGLVGKKDILFLDAHYHASGRFGAKSLGDRVQYFKHNDPLDLEQKILFFKESYKNTHNKDFSGQIFIAIEAVYSMSGEIAKADFATLAKELNALLIVDEAHSSGVLGDNLLGYFDYYNLKILPNFIKLGTLSKAYASYGAFILGSSEVISFLENRAKPAIYSTALSLFDTALAHRNFLYITKHKKQLAKKLHKRQKIATEILSPLFREEKIFQTPIVTIPIKDTQKLLQSQATLKKSGYFVGAIRKPTVEIPLLRVILSLNTSQNDTILLCKKLLKVVE